MIVVTVYNLIVIIKNTSFVSNHAVIVLVVHYFANLSQIAAMPLIMHLSW